MTRSATLSVFIGPALRGVTSFHSAQCRQMVMNILDPEPGDAILDPACGSAAFIMALEHVWRKLKEPERRLECCNNGRSAKSPASVFECNKDSFLAKVTKAYIIGDGRAASSVAGPALGGNSAQEKIKLGDFDLINRPAFRHEDSNQGACSSGNVGLKWKGQR